MFVYIIYRKKEKVNYFLFYFTGIFKKCFFLYNSLIQITDYLKRRLPWIHLSGIKILKN